MIQFRDKQDKLLLELNYVTRVSISKIYIDFSIKYISPDINGETLYLTKDEFSEPVLMYKIKDEFEFIDLDYETTSISKAYNIIGEVIEKLKYGISSYKGGNEYKKSASKSKKNQLNLEV